MHGKYPPCPYKITESTVDDLLHRPPPLRAVEMASNMRKRFLLFVGLIAFLIEVAQVRTVCARQFYYDFGHD